MDQITPDRLWRILGVQPTGGRLGQSAPGVVIETEVSRIPCTALIPKTLRSTILYCHAHGLRFDIGGREAIDGRGSLQDPPLGRALYEMGFAVIAPDMPGHGRRQHEGHESALSKAAHWRGETLFGHMMRDLCAVVDILPALGLPGPIGSVGFSMGSFLSLWVAAMRPDIAACAHLCGVTSLSALIETGNHDLHAPYLTVPGLLPTLDLPQIAASLAPRPQFVAAGLQDPLTPEATLEPLLQALHEAYSGKPGLTTLIDPEVGHVETRAMRTAVLSFFDAHL
ncbi:alpha/beta fold hydrolase [Gymnodinialimonas sp. 2305UL16-5]|uniref:alpha/beta hydrolase family protein n=1 Tax=Gymnodinialimonas mytili TaxID=3126503 RepID=UPI0030A9B4E7